MINKLSVFALIVAGLLLAGCKEDQVSEPKPPAAPAVEYVVKIESRPDTTDEFQRIHTYLPDGQTRVELEIQYRDGRVEKMQYRPDGTVEEKQDFYPHTDRLKSVTTYDTDGTTPLNSKSYRIFGPLESETEYSADGSSKTTSYRADGTTVHSVTDTAADGKASSTFYRKDGTTVWAKVDKLAERHLFIEYYDESGKLTHTRDLTSSGRTIVVMGEDGKPAYKQEWSGYWSPYSTYRYYNLRSVEVLDEDGQTVTRRLEYENYSSRPKSDTEFVDGEETVKRTYHYDGTVKSEEVLQEDGTWATESFSTGEKAGDPEIKEFAEEPEYLDPLDPANSN